MFWFQWGSKTRKKEVGQGFMNCPTCKCRQPAILYQHFVGTHIYYFIPVSESSVGPEFLYCRACQHEFVGNDGHAYDFGQHLESDTGPATCPKCAEPIPLDRLKCPSCGHRVD
jgi:hypothetical protein